MVKFRINNAQQLCSDHQLFLWPHSVHNRDHCLNYKDQLRQDINAHTFLHKVFVIYAQFNANQNMFTHFCRNPYTKFHENSANDSCLFHADEGRKEGRLDTWTIRYNEGNCHFLHLVNATKNCTWYNIRISSKWALM
jgi:hypothetical protein